MLGEVQSCRLCGISVSVSVSVSELARSLSADAADAARGFSRVAKRGCGGAATVLSQNQQLRSR